MSSESPQGSIYAEQNGHLLWITIDNPTRRNALSESMWRSLAAIVDSTEADASVRCRVITGAGERSFASGADIAQMEQRLSDQQDSYGAALAAACAALDRSSKPLVAMIRGYCFGAGVALAGKADLRLAADDAQFAIPAARMGLAYSLGFTRDLLRVIQPSAAKLLLFSADRIDAATALRVGLVDEVHAADILRQRVMALAEQITLNAPLSVRAAKLTIDYLSGKHEDAERVQALAEQCRASADHAEGMRAFLEKRSPRFVGR